MERFDIGSVIVVMAIILLYLLVLLGVLTKCSNQISEFFNESVNIETSESLE